MAYQQVSLATLQQELADKYESMPFWTTAEATLYLNEALRRWNMLTGQWHQRVTMLTSNVNGVPQVWYPVPGTILYDMRMDFNGIPMDQTTIGDLDYGMPGWEGQTTASGGRASSSPSLWAPVGLTMIAIWPADANLPNSLTLDGVAATPVLVNSTDFVDLGQDEHHALLSEALHVALFKGPQEWFATSKALHAQFIKTAADKNERLKASTFFRKEMGLDLNRGQRPLRYKMPEPMAPPQGQGAQ